MTTATIHEQAMAPLQRVEEAQEMQYPPENHPALEGARIVSGNQCRASRLMRDATELMICLICLLSSLQSRTLHTTPEDPARPPPPVVAGAKEKAVR